MKVFISWSGPRSRAFASTLREWLPSALQYVQPFMSEEDLGKGTRWTAELAAELESSNYGLICVTRSSMASQWLSFEAGAISKVVKDARVAPLAIDLTPTNISGPLSLFQATTRSREDVGRLLTSINSSAENPLSAGALSKSLEMWWPVLDEGWEKALAVEEGGASPPARTDREILEEILALARSENRIANLTTMPATARLPSPLLPAGGRRRQNRWPDLLDQETYRIIAERIAERVNVDPGDIRLTNLGGRVIAQLPIDPTQEDQIATSEWATAMSIEVLLRGPSSAGGLSDLV